MQGSAAAGESLQRRLDDFRRTTGLRSATLLDGSGRPIDGSGRAVDPALRDAARRAALSGVVQVTPPYPAEGGLTTRIDLVTALAGTSRPVLMSTFG